MRDEWVDALPMADVQRNSTIVSLQYGLVTRTKRSGASAGDELLYT
jgi:hypothetical protein